ncbi:MAG TPA: glycosyltransferase family 4 protein [Ignavibacteria bacterium]
MLHVAIICKTFLRGGAEKQALILTKLLKENSINVCLINWYGNKVDPGNLKLIQNYSLKYFPLTGSYFGKLKRFREILREENISIITSYLTLSNFVSGIIKIRNQEIICIGGIRNEKLPYYKFLIEIMVHNFCSDATVFNNYSAKEKFSKRGFDPQKIFVIQNAIELNNTLIRKGIRTNGEIRIITVGRFVKQKDYVTALNSFSALVHNNKDKNFTYYIVGYGPLKQKIRSMVKSLKVDQKVKVFINPPSIADILNDCDIFLSTSLFEGVSNSIMEAMAVGLPVVATKVGDNGYLVKDGFNGYLVPCKDVKSIVEKLEYLSESEDRRREFGRNSRTIIERDFSQTKFIDSYIRLFSRLLHS